MKDYKDGVTDQGHRALLKLLLSLDLHLGDRDIFVLEERKEEVGIQKEDVSVSV